MVEISDMVDEPVMPADVVEEKVAEFAAKYMQPAVSRARFANITYDNVYAFCVVTYEYGWDIDGVFTKAPGMPDKIVKLQPEDLLDDALNKTMKSFVDAVHTYCMAHMDI